MYRLRLIVCLVLSDVNVFLKLNCEREKEKKNSFNGLITTVILCILH